MVVGFLCKQKTAYEMRISDWSSDVCSSDLLIGAAIDSMLPDERIVLVGESAGASLALHTAAVDTRVSKVITLCGVAVPTTPVSARLRRKAPALDQAEIGRGS